MNKFLLKDAAALVGVHPNTLLNWERKGVKCAQAERHKRLKYRVYTEADIVRLRAYNESQEDLKTD